MRSVWQRPGHLARSSTVNHTMKVASYAFTFDANKELGDNRKHCSAAWLINYDTAAGSNGANRRWYAHKKIGVENQSSSYRFCYHNVHRCCGDWATVMGSSYRTGHLPIIRVAGLTHQSLEL